MKLHRVLLALLITCFAVSTSHAVAITVDGADYEISTVQGIYESNPAPFENQPWWGNAALAETFATTLADQLGLLHDGFFGPLFAYELDGERVKTYTYGTRSLDFDAPISWGAWHWATATRVNPVPESGPALVLLGSALVGLFALRRRLD